MACLAVPVSYVNWFHRILKLGGICFKKLLTSLHKGESNRLAVLQVHLWQPLCSKFHVVGCSTSRQYCSVLSKLSWVLKHNSRFWLAWVPTRDQNSIHLYTYTLNFMVCPGTHRHTDHVGHCLFLDNEKNMEAALKY